MGFSKQVDSSYPYILDGEKYLISNDNYQLTRSNDEVENMLRKNSGRIKYYLHKSLPRLKKLARLEFLFCQGLHAWGLLIIFFTDFDDKLMENYVQITTVIGIYQQRELYFNTACLVAFLPFEMMGKLWGAIVERYKKLRLERSLKSQPYNGSIKGEGLCSICLMDYVAQEKVTVLKCNSLHHFHTQCFQEWMRNSMTCPLCRKDLTLL